MFLTPLRDLEVSAIARRLKCTRKTTCPVMDYPYL